MVVMSVIKRKQMNYLKAEIHEHLMISAFKFC